MEMWNVCECVSMFCHRFACEKMNRLTVDVIDTRIALHSEMQYTIAKPLFFLYSIDANAILIIHSVLASILHSLDLCLFILFLFFVSSDRAISEWKKKNNETAAAKHSIINHHYTYTNPFWMRFMPIDCRLESGASTRGSRNRLDLPPPSIQQRHNWSGSCDKFIHCSWLHKCITAVCVRCDCAWNNNISPLNINVYTVFSFYFRDTHLSMLKQLSNEFENSREIQIEAMYVVDVENADICPAQTRNQANTLFAVMRMFLHTEISQFLRNAQAMVNVFDCVVFGVGQRQHEYALNSVAENDNFANLNIKWLTMKPAQKRRSGRNHRKFWLYKKWRQNFYDIFCDPIPSFIYFNTVKNVLGMLITLIIVRLIKSTLNAQFRQNTKRT